MKRILLLMVVFLSLQCQASLIIAPAIFEGVASDFPEIMTLDIYNQGNDEVVVEVDVFKLSQKPSGFISKGSKIETKLVPDKSRVVVEPSSKAAISFERENTCDSLYEVAVVRHVSTDNKTISQAVAVPFILKQGDSEADAVLEAIRFNKDDGLFEITIKNNGLEHFKTEVTLSLLDSAPRTSSAQGIVLPGVSRVFNIQVPLDSFINEGQLEVKLGNVGLIYDLSLNMDTGVVDYVVKK